MDDSSRLRRKDTTKGPPLRILSLDGGGVRGYSMLIILQELMHRTFVEIEGRAPRRHEIPKPCDHFDLIVGTGTGGLIAIMLGRLRLDLDTCKDVYVRMTRRVFETDKTIAGIPFKSTMFKASKLEEVIKECVREHTVFEDEGNDSLANATPMSASVGSASPDLPRRTTSQSSRYSQLGQSPTVDRRVASSFGQTRWGNPNALLYDTRENRTKTAVTAVLKGTSVTTLLRSYDSRKETAPDVNCAIWQAGRATSATAMAFKPIQIGQSVYLDEGTGKYNPAPQVLDEAVKNEWPGREVGVFVSIGTGKRPAGTNNKQHEWWEGFLGGAIGDFAEARRRLISKLEGCEETHQYMLREQLSARGVNVENYYRLNVEIGVGEFGMNEWARLAEISTNTRTYLTKSQVECLNSGAAAKLAKIHFAKVRHERSEARRSDGHAIRGEWNEWNNPWDRPLSAAPITSPLAAELPGDAPVYQTESFRPGSRETRPSFTDQKYIVVNDDETTPTQASVSQNQSTLTPRHPSAGTLSPTGQHPPPRTHQNSAGSIHSNGTNSPRHSSDHVNAAAPPLSPPPLPPKTPLPYPDHQLRSPTGPTTFMNMGELGRRLPYPDVDGPPPVVNTASKPTLTR